MLLPRLMLPPRLNPPPPRLMLLEPPRLNPPPPRPPPPPPRPPRASASWIVNAAKLTNAVNIARRFNVLRILLSQSFVIGELDPLRVGVGHETEVRVGECGVHLPV